MKNRIKRIVSLLEKENLDALLVNFQPNVRYLSGYDGTNGLVLLTFDKGLFITDFRYQEQAKKEVKDLKLHLAQRELIYDLAKFKFLQKRNQRIGFEANHTSYSTVQKLKEILPNALLVPTENLVESLLIIKDKGEVAKIEKAAQITDKAFSHILDLVKPGVREKDLAAEIEHGFKRMGGDGPAFSTIVASGYRSSMPHGRASDKKLKVGEFVTFDMGAIYQGYVSDMTRTLILGRATPKQRKIYNLVLKAQTKAISRAKAGIRGMELDKVAREVIAKAGYGKYFGHGLGHGLGLEVHSGPVVNARSKTILKPGMVITIEPGIYIPGWGGVRIEDDVLITPRGCKVLNQSPKNLIEIR
jgi:Xaa-Pro aminopeptidase